MRILCSVVLRLLTPLFADEEPKIAQLPRVDAHEWLREGERESSVRRIATNESLGEARAPH
nr:MAG: hypothetical protein DIU78_23505 [Pseudomonadota bacterium]